MMSHHSHRRRRTNIDPVRRVILASPNHVMGGYKDDPSRGPSSIHPHSDPKAGTLPLDPDLVASSGDGVAYAAAKLAAERLAMALGDIHGSTTTFVVLRIGWCQPGENSPATLSAAGSPPEHLLDGGGGGVVSSSSSSSSGMPTEQSEDEAKDEAWYKRMWLSNRDFLTYFSAAMDFEVPTEEPTPSGGGTRSGKREEGGARTGTSGGDSSWSTPCRATAMPSGISTTSRGGWGSLVRTIPWPDIPRAWTIHRSIKSNQMALAATCVPTPCYERLRYRR